MQQKGGQNTNARGLAMAREARKLSASSEEVRKPKNARISGKRREFIDIHGTI